MYSSVAASFFFCRRRRQSTWGGREGGRTISKRATCLPCLAWRKRRRKYRPIDFYCHCTLPFRLAHNFPLFISVKLLELERLRPFPATRNGGGGGTTKSIHGLFSNISLLIFPGKREKSKLCRDGPSIINIHILLSIRRRASWAPCKVLIFREIKKSSLNSRKMMGVSSFSGDRFTVGGASRASPQHDLCPRVFFVSQKKQWKTEGGKERHRLASLIPGHVGERIPLLTPFPLRQQHFSSNLEKIFSRLFHTRVTSACSKQTCFLFRMLDSKREESQGERNGV